MKFSSQEEYGLRCLLQIAQAPSANGLTIPEISRLEDLNLYNIYIQAGTNVRRVELYFQRH
jgi:DNA-binding IscR family transcriptional regulator